MVSFQEENGTYTVNNYFGTFDQKSGISRYFIDKF